MRLLDTAFIELKWLYSPEDGHLPSSSHVWHWQGDSKQTSNDLAARSSPSQLAVAGPINSMFDWSSSRPLCIVFLAHDWTPLGTKPVLVPFVQEITAIDAGVLTFHKRLEGVSVARHVSWAANCRTRRVEDEAYCLVRLFGVNMPTIYGEGAKAFRHLQEEIMWHSADQTLFAWGTVMPQHIHRENLVTDTHNLSNSLFAPSPAAFAHSARRTPISTEDLAFKTDGLCRPSEDASQLFPEFTLTGHGVRCRLPVINGGEYALAVLACRDTPDSGVRAPQTTPPLRPSRGRQTAPRSHLRTPAPAKRSPPTSASATPHTACGPRSPLRPPGPPIASPHSPAAAFPPNARPRARRAWTSRCARARAEPPPHALAVAAASFALEEVEPEPAEDGASYPGAVPAIAVYVRQES
ncbi:hypothetical protein BC628DRAFT_1417954 [Trametes gibbosa]|nr:hypothetical protein BC628DRAFT_1417954 [Trametes gibbosa]